MESNQIMEKVFESELLFRIIDYLNIQEVLRMSQSNKKLYIQINDGIKKILQKSSIIEEKQDQKLKQKELLDQSVMTLGQLNHNQFQQYETNINYYQILRSHFNRQIFSIPLYYMNDENQEQKVYKYNQFSNLGICDFQIGPVFSKIKLFNNDVLVNETDKFIDPLSQSSFKKYLDVKQLSTHHFYLVQLDKQGIVFIEFQDRSRVQLDLDFKVDQFWISFNFLVLSSNEQSSLLVIGLKDFDNETMNDNKRRKTVKIDDQEMKQYKQIGVGKDQLLYLNTNGQLFICRLGEFKYDQQEDLVFQLFEYFKKKHITRIFHGYQGYMALNTKDVLRMQDWQNEEVLEWANSIKEFEDYVQIMKYEKVDGNMLNNADLTFLQERLGMTRKDLISLFYSEIQKHQKRTFKGQKLYVWGSNQFNKLGIPGNQITCMQPQRISLSFDDEIIDIKFNHKQTVFLTMNGKVFSTINKQDKKPKVQENKQQQQQQKNHSKNKRKNSQQNFRQQQQQQQQNESEQSSQVIVEVLKSVSVENQIFKVNLNRDQISLIVSGSRKKQKGQQKFKAGDQIISRILWDESINKKDFIVGYEDRFLGILEVTVDQFMMSEAKDHRIRYFKQNGKVVWDRNTKLDIIQ